MTSKAYLNTLASLLDYISKILVGFVTNPWIVNSVGLHLYGVWQFLGRWSGYTTLVGGRPSIALRWKIANLQASSDYAEKRRILGSAIIVWLMLGPLFVLLGGILIWATPFILSTSSQYYPTIRITIGLLLVGNLMIGLAELPRYILQGENKAYKRMGLSTLMTMAGGGLMIFVLYLKAGIIGLAGIYALMIVAEGIFFLQVVRKHISWIGVEWPSLQEVRSYFSLNWWYMGWLIVYQLFLSSDLVILGLLTTPDQVAIYSLNKYAPEVAISLIIMMLSGVLPGMGVFIGGKEFDRVRSLRGELFSLIWMVGLAIASVAVIWNRSFVTLWVGGDRYAGNLLTLLITIKVFQFILLITDAAILDLTLDMKAKVIFGAISLISSFALSILAISVFHLGTTGLVLAYLIGQSILMFAYPWIVLRYLGIKVSRQWLMFARPLGISAAVFAISIFLGSKVLIHDWVSLIVLCALTFFVAIAFAYFYGLPRQMRTALLNRLPFYAS